MRALSWPFSQPGQKPGHNFRLDWPTLGKPGRSRDLRTQTLVLVVYNSVTFCYISFAHTNKNTNALFAYLSGANEILIGRRAVQRIEYAERSHQAHNLKAAVQILPPQPSLFALPKAPASQPELFRFAHPESLRIAASSPRTSTLR
jgi:hypothetical protein